MDIISLHTYLLFIGAVVVLVLVPGPDMMYMLGRTVAQGRRAGLIAAVGFNVGGYVHLAAAIAGLSAILATSSLAFTIVKWAGALYLLWLGFQTLRASGGNRTMGEKSLGVLNTKAIFWQGFWSDVLNPKVAVFFLAFLPQFTDVGGGHQTAQLLLLGVTCNVVAILLNLVLVCCASTATRSLRSNPKISTWLNRSLGALFIAIGVRLASEKL